MFKYISIYNNSFNYDYVIFSGQKIWCGSLGVCEYLMDHSELVLNKIVIELGAGTGLLGTIKFLFL